MTLLPDGQEYAVHCGDAITHMMEEMPPACVDFCIHSPPFPSVYSYTSEGCDIGNSEDLSGDGKLHLSFFFRALRRVMKPGRVVIVHCQDIPRMKRAGGQGLFDFRGLLIRLGERAGFTHEYAWSIRKNPQQQALRVKAWELKFQGLETDRCMSRGALPDYLLKFRTPGENATPIVGHNQVSRNDWIAWAEHCWSDIKESDTLNLKGTKREEDTRHICPLQLELIRRCILIFSNPGELVFSPFAGIGSEGYMALGGATRAKPFRRIEQPRRFYGCEIREDWHATALANMADAVKQREDANRTLFDALEVPS